MFDIPLESIQVFGNVTFTRVGNARIHPTVRSIVVVDFEDVLQEQGSALCTVIAFAASSFPFFRMPFQNWPILGVNHTVAGV